MAQTQTSTAQDFTAKFNPGTMAMTAGICDKMAGNVPFCQFVIKSIRRHLSGDWGDLCEEDREQNEEGLKNEGRLFSAYEDKARNEKIWIITEWDRSVTTVLFPDEY